MTLKIKTDKKGKFIKYKGKKYHLPKGKTFTQSALLKWVVKKIAKERIKLRSSIKSKLKAKIKQKAKTLTWAPSLINAPTPSVHFAPTTSTASSYAALLNAQAAPTPHVPTPLKPEPSTALIALPGNTPITIAPTAPIASVAPTPPTTPRHGTVGAFARHQKEIARKAKEEAAEAKIQIDKIHDAKRNIDIENERKQIIKRVMNTVESPTVKK